MSEAAPTLPDRHRRRGSFWSIWAPGIGLLGAALLAVAALGLLDAARSSAVLRAAGSKEPEAFSSLFSLLTPDPAGASWTMALVGTSEGVAIAIVIVVVVLGVQLTADRYSPRIIDIFVRDPLNLLVLALFLASIVFTIVVSAEIKETYVPMFGVFTAMALAVVDFAILMPYVRYMFSIMRAETIIGSLSARGRNAVRRAAAGGEDLAARHAMRDTMAQVADIALGSIQEGDTEVCLDAIEALRHLIVDDYMPLKSRLGPWWFSVDSVDMPGASDQTISHVDRTGTWVEHSVLSDFLDLIGETPAFRKSVIHAIARATRSIGDAAIERDDRDVEDLVIRFFNTYLRAAMNQRAPTFAYSTFNEYRALAVHALESRPELVMRVAEHLVTYGRSFDAAGMPFIIGTAAEDVADMATRTAPIDLDRAILLAQLLQRTIVQMAPVAQPIALNGILKALIKLELWAIAAHQDEIAGTLLVGIRAVPEHFVYDALDRMQRTTQDVFWEVSDRVVAFDWVDPELRELIPMLRERLAGGGAAAAGPRPVAPSPA